MANAHTRDRHDPQPEDAQRTQPGQQLYEPPAGYTGPTRVNVSGLRLGMRLQRLPENMFPGGYTDKTLAELLMMYECLKVHPDFKDKTFTDLQDGIDHLLSELMRLCGMHHKLSYDDYECFEWANPANIKMPESLSLVGQTNNTVFVGEQFLILELWPVYHQPDPIVQLVMISACVIMYQAIGIPFFNDTGFAPIHMKDEDFINWDMEHAVHYEVDRFSPKYKEQLADYNRKKELVEKMTHEYKEYVEIRNKIESANLTASVRVVRDYIKNGDNTGLIQWLEHVIRIYQAKLDVRLWAPIYPLVGHEDCHPFNDFNKIGMYYRNDWPLVDISASIGAQIEHDHGHAGLMNGTILMPSGYRLPKQEIVPVIASLKQLLTFQLNTFSYESSTDSATTEIEQEIEIEV
jgi:hypothetical protein